MKFLHTVALGVSLFAAWLAFSGHYTVFLMSIGAASAAFCVLVAARMGTLDEEGVPLHVMGPRLISYGLWLVWEIIKSAWSVTKVILNPRLPISPTMTRVKAGQKSSVGIAVYANSITLTPGTITVGVECFDTSDTGVRADSAQHCRDLIIHALVSDGADDLEAGTMDVRVTRFEGAS